MKITDLPWIAVLLAVLLTGCGLGDDNNEASAPQATAEAEQPDSSAEAVTAAQDSGATSKPFDTNVEAEPPLPRIISPSRAPSAVDNSRVASLEGSILVDLLLAKTLPIQLTPGIEGAWQQDCSLGENGASYNSRVIYQDGKMTLYAHNYSDSQCQNTLARIQMSGRYSVGQTTQLDSGELVNFLTQNINSIKAAYYGKAVIQASNDLELCGISNWSEGELQSVSDCDAFDIRAMEKNIIKVVGQQLVYGESSSRDATGYPSQLEEDILFFKAPTPLEGNWFQECKVVGQSGQSRFLEIVGNSVLEQWTLFSDTGCDNILFSQINAYQVDFGKTRILASGESVIEMTNTIFSGDMALHSLEVSDYFNHPQSALNCGATPWQQDELKDVLECLNIQTTVSYTHLTLPTIYSV